MQKQISRRDFAARIMAAGVLPGLLANSCRSEKTAALNPDDKLTVDVEPGRYYLIKLPRADSVSPGTRWAGGKLVEKDGKEISEPSLDAGPLSPMYTQRIIWKLDDLSDWCFESWKRFIGVIDRHGGKADLGVNPGRCSPEVFEWMGTLDQERFEFWNHTWDHGRQGPRQAGQPYDVQYRNLDIGQQKVKQELGITMRAFGAAGIRPYEGADTWIGDGDELTYYVIRNHPDLSITFSHPDFADKGFGNINTDGILTLKGTYDPEHPDGINSEPETRDYDKKYRASWVAETYPAEDPMRLPGVGNPEELIWRLEHPHTGMEIAAEMPVTNMTCHPWNWNTERGLESAGSLCDYILKSEKLRFTNSYEAFRWLSDREDLALEKLSPDTYRLEAQFMHYSHQLDLALPKQSSVETRVYTWGELESS